MRNIEFRGKHLVENKWFYGYYSYEEKTGRHHITLPDGRPFNVIPETVGQYTGRKDKNGKKIYDGSIYKWENGDIGYVEWDEQTTGFCRRRKENPAIPYALYADSQEHIEVIGNIHENPKLLKD